MSDPLAPALAVFRAAGFAAVDVPVLLPMEDFVRISGEEFRRRIFTTTDQRGTEYCLRPEFTIPVCRSRLAVEPGGGRYSYSGRIFRNGRPGEADEVWQIGGEMIGQHDTAEADAEALALALDVTGALGLGASQVVVGDVGLFAALLAALAIPPAWTRRLITLFGDPDRVLDTLAAMTDARPGFADFRGHGLILKALEDVPAAKVGELFADILSIAGVKTVGGRTTAEIAERVLEQAMLAENRVPDGTVAAIRALMAIDTPFAEAPAALDALSAGIGRPARFEAALDLFRRRAEAIGRRARPGATLRFSAAFGRKLGYYDGFVFDVMDGARPDLGQVAGGGRYDGLLAGFGAAPETRAVGFAVWTERLTGATLGATS